MRVLRCTMYRRSQFHLGALNVLFIALCLGDVLLDNLVSRDTKDLCFVWGHRLALINDRLYIMHGNYTFTTQSLATPQPYLFYLDLSTNLTVEDFLSPSSLQRYTLPSNMTPNAAVVNEDNAAFLWYSNEKLYAPNLGGHDDTLATFDIATGDWSFVPVSGHYVHSKDISSDLKDRSSEMSVSIPSSGLAFSFGDWLLPGLVKFDGSVPQSLTWTSQTTGGSQGIQVPLVSEAEMVYVPMGKEGVLLLMGGMDASHSLDGTPMIPLSQISVYDIESSSWFAVTASGEIPANRGQFCAVVSASPDNSSFQVTIFGGWDSHVSLDYEDVYILTVPSFRWIKANVTDDFQTEAITSIGRAHHRCVVYNNAQMIMIGGSIRFGTAQQTDETACRSAYPPIRVLDTSTYHWKNSFDPSIKYTVPYVVTSVIGGDASGNATLTVPEGGWNFTALQDIFSLQAAKSNDAQASASPTASSSPTPSSTKKPSSDHKAAIAGGVVGGIIGLSIIAGLIFYACMRRSRSQAQERGESWTKPELPQNAINPNDRNTYEKDAYQGAELDPANRFEIGDSFVPRELDATNERR